MIIQVGDKGKVKGSKTGRVLIVEERMGYVPLCRPEHEPNHALVAIDPCNFIIVERANETN